MPVDRLVLDDETAPVDRDGAKGGLRLLVVADGQASTHALPARAQLTLGRGEDNDIRIDHPSVSRRHAVLEVDDGQLRIRDLGSANGTRVSRREAGADRPVAVEPGEVIELGGTWLFVHGVAPGIAASVASVPAVASGLRAAGRPIVLEDPVMQRLFELVERVAPSELSVLVLGETGAGKEIVAEAVHAFSRRSKGPLLKLNCGALPRTLLEGELFGHEKGAFTGATEARPGLFESASGGTVFLDEIGEIPPEVQVALLRVVEDRKVLRIGGREPREIDVRFVAATNRDLRADVKAGTFRGDLYFRLNGVSVVVPPLRERPTEILPLARFFAARGSGVVPGGGTPRGETPELSPEARVILEGYSWPGNLRELRNVVERAVVLAGGGSIREAHLPAELSDGADVRAAAAGPLRSEVEGLERRRILAALEECSGNQTRAAELLGMPRRTFLKRLDAYGIARPRKK